MGLLKLLKKALIPVILVPALLVGCKNKPPQIEEKYAIICTGSSMRNRKEGLISPKVKNAFWISTVRVYNELLKSEYKPENIYVLYSDGKPPFNDEEFLEEIKEIKKEFDGSYSNIATKSRLEELLNSLEYKIKPKDKFTLYINMHGSKPGILCFYHDNSVLSGKELYNILKGNKSKKILIFGDICYAESFTKDIDYNSIIISASKRDFYGWGDRNFSCGSYFFQEMNNKGNDTDKDGKVSPYEAFLTTKKRCIKYRKELDKSLRKEYGYIHYMRQWVLRHMDLIPLYRENH